MHRSGTSAITGVLAALGLHVPRPKDLMPGADDNPHFWESLTAYEINSDLLERLGGSWDAPPELAEGWEQDPAIRSAHDTPKLMAKAYTRDGPSVWKDPRMSILFPYWKLYLPGRFAAVLIWRPPIPVARSLEVRNGIAVPDGVALWERYNRAAIEGLDGIDTLVIGYDSAVEDPPRLVETVVRWLGTLDGFDPGTSGWDVDKAGAVMSADLRHQQEARADDDDALLPEHRALVDYLAGLEGTHHPFRAALPCPESRWATALIDRRRNVAALERELTAARIRQHESDVERDHLTNRLAETTNRLAEEQAVFATRLAEEQQAFAKRLAEEQQAVQVHQDAVRSLEQLLEAYRDQLDAAARQLNATTRRLNGLYESTSWRMTRPLRSGIQTLHRISRTNAPADSRPGRGGGAPGGQ
jgi:hypothetical protein